MGIASMVLGIVSTVWAVFGTFTNWVAVLIGVVGVVLGAIGKKKHAKCAVAGLVLSIVGVGLALILWLACLACAASVGNGINSLF